MKRTEVWLDFFISFIVHLCALVSSDEHVSKSTEYHFYPGTSPYHLTGYQYNTNAWRVTVNNKSQTYLTYGPYSNISTSTKRCGDSIDIATHFLLSIDNNNNDNLTILTVDVHDAQHDIILESRDISRTDFYKSNQPQNFSLCFENPNCSNSLEFRVYYHCCAEITHYDTIGM